MTGRFFALFALILGLVNTSSSQNYVELVNLKYDIGAPSDFEGSPHSSSIQDGTADVLLPIPVSERLAVLTGYTFNRTSVHVFGGKDPAILQSQALKAGFNYKLSDIWSFSVMALPKFAGSEESGVFDHRSFQIGGVVLLKKVIHSNLNHRAGLYVNTEQFGLFMVPILGFYSLSPNEKWEWTVMAPISMDVNRKLGEKWFAGLNYLGQVRSYNLDSENYVVKTSNEPHLYLRYAPKGRAGLCIEAGVGRSIGRSYRAFNDGDRIPLGFPLIYLQDDRKQVNMDFEDGFVYRFRVRYRLPI